ncbi:hypothetical protein [Nonomuraea sp. NPDC049758]|uniref:hypothetical protein n=1 Tax=Nonomuraea sp. NPDC049758 TaxID=3154360 RepID=UPI00343AF2EA
MTVAGAGSRRETLVIRGDQVPSGETEVHPKAEIQRLLATSQPDLVKLAGSTYISTAEAVLNAVVGLEDDAGRILTIWKGPDADRARIALELLYATGNELARKLAEMGRSLEGYAASIPVAIAEVEGIKLDKNDPDVQEVVRVHRALYGLDRQGDDEANAVALLENMRAQAALRKLNEKIRDLHLGSVPYDITYELPAVRVPGGPLATTSVVYGGTGRSDDPTTGAGDPAGTGTGDGRTTGAGDPGTQDQTSRDGADDAAPGTPPDDQPAGSDQPAGGPTPGRQPGDQAGDTGTGAGAGTEDGTTPPVIGAQDRTELDDATPEADPGRTESSFYQPTIGDRPPLVATPGRTAAPVATNQPVPSVIGTPNSAYTPGGRLGTMRGGSAAALSGTPFLPITGGAGPIGDAGGDLERTTYLSEDRSAWNGNHDVTDPVIR